MKGLSVKIKVITATSMEELQEAVRLYCVVALQNGEDITAIKYSNPEKANEKRVLFATITTEMSECDIDLGWMEGLMLWQDQKRK